MKIGWNHGIRFSRYYIFFVLSIMSEESEKVTLSVEEIVQNDVKKEETAIKRKVKQLSTKGAGCTLGISITVTVGCLSSHLEVEEDRRSKKEGTGKLRRPTIITFKK